MNGQPQEIDFARLVDALSPWLDQLVFIGGWAHRLYRLHPLATSPEYPALMTVDADVAVPEKTRLAGQSIRDRLLAADFKEEFMGEHRPPVTHYVLGAEHGDFYAEFLTPLVGAAYSRSKRPVATAEVAGVTVQKLRHLEILLARPWGVQLSPRVGFPITQRTAQVQIPNAASYLVHKLLINEKRAGEERSKDILYIHDTIELFAHSLNHVRREWINNVRPHLHQKTIRAIQEASEKLFGVAGDDLRRAAMTATGRALTPEQVQEVCRQGLREMFA